MSQQKTIQSLLAAHKANSPAQQLDAFYAENLTNISGLQSKAAGQQSLSKAQQLLQQTSPAPAKSCNTATATKALKQLNHHLNQSTAQPTSQQPLSFSEQAETPPEANAQNQGFAELQSRRAFLSMQQRTFANHIVQQAIEQGPENPGPLNPQQLAINALKNMRDLSPAYLSRYVSYVDSLFALEHIGKQLAKANKSKT